MVFITVGWKFENCPKYEEEKMKICKKLDSIPED
jgi:hypothetical protein